MPDSVYDYVCLYVCVYEFVVLQVFTEGNNCKLLIYVARLAIVQEMTLIDILPGL